MKHHLKKFLWPKDAFSRVIVCIAYAIGVAIVARGVYDLIWVY